MDRLFGTLMGFNKNNEEKEPEGSWRCNVCSYENCGLLPNCEMCDNARGTEPAPTPPLVKQHPKMTPLVMVNDQGDYKLYNSDKDKEKGGEDSDDSPSTTPLDEQLRAGRETMNAISLNKSLEEEKFKAVLDLTRAAAEGDAETLVALFNRFSSEDLDYPGALHSSASNGHVQAVKVFVEHNYDIDAVSGSLLPNTPLSLAAAGGHLQVVEYLLERGANVNKCGTDQTSPLYHAIKNGHHKIVETLLTHYASLTTGFPGTTPLILACENGHTAIANLILSKGVDVNQPGGDKQYTPLHAAAKTGNLGLVATLLLQPNINTEATDADERVPLQYAMQAGMRVHASVEQLFTTFWLEQHETLQVIRDTWRPDAETQPQISMQQEKETEREKEQPEEEQSLKRRTKEEKAREKKEMEELEMRLLREQQESAAKLGDSSTIPESVSSSSEGETSQVKEEVIEENEPTREELEAFELRLLKEQQEEAERTNNGGGEGVTEAHRDEAEGMRRLEEYFMKEFEKEQKEQEEEAKLQEEAERKFFEEMNRLEDMTRKEPEQKPQEQVNVEKVEEQKEKEEEGIPLVIKLVDNEDNLRRFSFRVTEDKHRNFERLFETLNQQVLNVTTGKVQLKYKDEDGDLITVCTDEDLAEAIRHAESKGSKGRIPVLRVHVKY